MFLHVYIKITASPNIFAITLYTKSWALFFSFDLLTLCIPVNPIYAPFWISHLIIYIIKNDTLLSIWSKLIDFHSLSSILHSQECIHIHDWLNYLPIRMRDKRRGAACTMSNVYEKYVTLYSNYDETIFNVFYLEYCAALYPGKPFICPEWVENSALFFLRNIFQNRDRIDSSVKVNRDVQCIMAYSEQQK